MVIVLFSMLTILEEEKYTAGIYANGSWLRIPMYVKQPVIPKATNLQVNIFPGFPHTLQTLSDFENRTHLAVKFIFSHIQDVWCSGDWDLTEYIIKWLTAKKEFELIPKN
ncbi:uncharacterized protein OCT59_014705 [Rhizophagus irregularis]|uniref:uncharacterized protein n=1 Tax=Rhizophagus irregularis TaxID=588596 RepID=UPI001A0F2326|nr:hypothetical protein OCT59_014705 [Rhizophagus irregularis]GBC44137.2 hypothetical protein RIR_jg15231.t1 [Rhizophagus irregularis DAOM 181602=DAOM 197198]